jgi:hypothetical protein
MTALGRPPVEEALNGRLKVGDLPLSPMLEVALAEADPCSAARARIRRGERQRLAIDDLVRERRVVESRLGVYYVDLHRAV